MSRPAEKWNRRRLRRAWGWLAAPGEPSRTTGAMIGAALLAFGALAVVHLQGWRMNVAFLSGTVPTTSEALMTGLLYAGCWFTGVVIAPVLLLSGLILHLRSRPQ